MKDLFGNMPEAAKPNDAGEAFKFTELERFAICDKISDFADTLVNEARHPDNEEVIALVNEIEELIAKEVEQA